MTTEWQEVRSTARPVCPNCKRYRGVRWRIKADSFVCTLCGHTWPKENGKGAAESSTVPDTVPDTDTNVGHK